MTQYVFANNVNTTLAASATSTQTTLTLGSATNLPTLSTGQVMPLTLNDAATRAIYEIVYVTAISGSTLTVTRGEEGTTAVAWNTGDYAYCAFTGGTVADAYGNPANTFEVADSTSGTNQAIPRSQGDVLYSSVSPTGSLIMFAGSSAPSGWMICNGVAISRTTYATLYGVIGTTYGAGDGSTTFNIPNLQSSVPLGVGTGPGLSTYTLGETGGEETHTLDLAEIPSHAHSYFNFGSNRQAQSGGSGSGAGYYENQTTGYEGGGGAHNNIQPYLAVNFIIKT